MATDKICYNLKAIGCRAKGTKLWASWASTWSIQCTFDCLVCKVGLMPFGTFRISTGLHSRLNYLTDYLVARWMLDIHLTAPIWQVKKKSVKAPGRHKSIVWNSQILTIFPVFLIVCTLQERTLQNAASTTDHVQIISNVSKSFILTVLTKAKSLTFSSAFCATAQQSYCRGAGFHRLSIRRPSVKRVFLETVKQILRQI